MFPIEAELTLNKNVIHDELGVKKWKNGSA